MSSGEGQFRSDTLLRFSMSLRADSRWRHDRQREISAPNAKELFKNSELVWAESGHEALPGVGVSERKPGHYVGNSDICLDSL